MRNVELRIARETVGPTMPVVGLRVRVYALVDDAIKAGGARPAAAAPPTCSDAEVLASAVMRYVGGAAE